MKILLVSAALALLILVAGFFTPSTHQAVQMPNGETWIIERGAHR